MTEQEHYFVIVFGSVEQSLEFAYRIVGGTSVAPRSLSVAPRRLSVMAGTRAITGCIGTVVDCMPAFVGGIGEPMRHGVGPLFGGLISLLCRVVCLDSDVIALGGTLIVDLSLAFSIVELVASH